MNNKRHQKTIINVINLQAILWQIEGTILSHLVAMNYDDASALKHLSSLVRPEMGLGQQETFLDIGVLDHAGCGI